MSFTPTENSYFTIAQANPIAKTGLILYVGVIDYTNNLSNNILDKVNDVISALTVALGGGLPDIKSKAHNNSIVLGYNAADVNSANENNVIAIGANTQANLNGIAFGNNANANDGIAIGNNALTTNTNAIALGKYAKSSGNFAVQIGGDLNDSSIVENNEDKTLKFYNGSSNITIVNADGKLNVDIPIATDDKIGGIKLGYSLNDNNYPVKLDTNNKAYVTVDSKSSGISFDDIYPIGSIYISINKELPTVFNEKQWVRIAAGRCLFGADAKGQYSPKSGTIINVGEEVDAGLPLINFSGTTDSDGAHSHNISANTMYDTLDIDSGSSIKLASTSTEIDGQHSHNFSGTTSFNSTSTTTDTNTTNTVQPPALVVSIWQRVS